MRAARTVGAHACARATLADREALKWAASGRCWNRGRRSASTALVAVAVLAAAAATTAAAAALVPIGAADRGRSSKW